MADGLPIELEFAGGAELLIKGKRKNHSIVLPSSPKSNDKSVKTLGDLLVWVKENLVAERPELLIDGGNTVRPGILVLINDTDWELLGETAYVLQPKDKITLISTLHGG